MAEKRGNSGGGPAWWRLVRAVATAGALGLGLLGTSQRDARAADVCDPSCDVDCVTCCRTWTLQAVCVDGTGTRQRGTFPSMREALNAATTAAPPDTPCGDRSTPRWRPYCAPENATPSPLDGPNTVTLIGLGTPIAQRLRDVREAQAALFEFGEKRLLNKSGQQRIGDAAASLRQSRAALVASLGTFEQLKAHGEPADAEVSAFDKSNADVRQAADDAVGRAHALMADVTAIDTDAEARRERISAAIAAQKAREEAEKARQEDLKRQRELAEERRRQAAEEAEAARRAAVVDAEQKRQAAIEAAAKQAELARQAAADAAARRAEAARKAEADRQRAEAEKQRAAAAQAAQAFQSNYDTAVGMARADLSLCSDTIASLTMIDMQSSASKEMKARAIELRTQLENAKDKLREVMTRAFAAKNKQPVSAAAPEMVAIRASAQAAHEETARLVSAAHQLHP